MSRRAGSGRLSTPLCLLLAALAAFHLSLTEKGALAWPDEFLYRDAFSALESLGRLDIEGFARHITGFGARPAEALLRLPPAGTQLLLERMAGVSRFSPESLRIPALLNVVTSLLLLYAFHQLATRLLPDDRETRLVATLVYGLLVGNQAWVRHILPYDTALFVCLLSLREALALEGEEFVSRPRPQWPQVFLVFGSLGAYPLVFYRFRSAGLPAAVAVLMCLSFVLWRAARNSEDTATGRSIRAGLLGGLGLAFYPAFYAFHAATCVIIASSGGLRRGVRPGRVRAAFLFGVSLLVVLLSFETLARVGGVSYLGGAARLSRNITQGSPGEGFLYFIKYHAEVEGPIGLSLLLLGGFYLGTLAIGLARRRAVTTAQATLARCALVFLSFHALQAFQSVMLHRMTFSGRYIRMYVPIFVLASMSVLGRIASRRPRRMALAAVAMTSLASFAPFAVQYSQVDYPINVLHRLGIGFEDVRHAHRVYESDIIPDNLPVKVMTPGSRYVTRPDDDRYILVNFGFLDLQGREFSLFSPPPGADLFFRARHFLCYRSSWFEGYGAPRRRQFRESACELKVYRLPDGT